jgi:hypothetical protein
MEQESNIQRKRVVYSIVTVWHMVHDLYVKMYGSDQRPQHPHWHNQLPGQVVIMSDITQHIDFLSPDSSKRRIQLSCCLLNKTRKEEEKRQTTLKALRACSCED